jgi:hypothetical protein
VTKQQVMTLMQLSPTTKTALSLPACSGQLFERARFALDKKINNADPECSGKVLKERDRCVPLAVLELGQVARCNASFMRESLLTEPPLQS